MDVITFKDLNDDPKNIILDKARKINLPKIPKFIKTDKQRENLLLQICKYKSFDFTSKKNKLNKLSHFFYIFMSTISYEHALELSEIEEEQGFPQEYIPSPFFFSGRRNKDKFQLCMLNLVHQNTIINKRNIINLELYFLNKYKIVDKYLNPGVSGEYLQYGNYVLHELFWKIRSVDIISLINDIVKNNYHEVACYLNDEMIEYTKFNKTTDILNKLCYKSVINKSEYNLTLITKYYKDFLIQFFGVNSFEEFTMYSKKKKIINNELILQRQNSYFTLMAELINPRGSDMYNNYKPFVNSKMLTNFIQSILFKNEYNKPLIIGNILNIIHPLLTELDIKGIFNYLTSSNPIQVCDFIFDDIQSRKED